ncbi:asparagine synthase (glutamine-hydrolyzing) [Pandoraea cepalis]|uniref:asparagine synthase (glutamine-hydrolyzing) n=2 Tax=Pandoraea cepalis TaxID=2508294 RepID=A0A5E4XFB6_9BURK|nr:asparagine synthase (glutamine-hydrolyzing) [Pandoraea cepalis]
MAHRGPDDSGQVVFHEDNIGLAQRRLAIIDLSSTGHQPMFSHDSNVCIVFNGEIYNYRELRQALVADGYEFRGQSDTEVLLVMYEKHGEAMLSHLNGIFAFALWDKRKRQMFVARDQLGIKPFYYTCDSFGFAFASEMKVLLRGGLASSELDPAAVLAHLGFLWSPGERTIAKAVRKLEPGHAMIVRDGRIERNWKYYDLPYGQPYLMGTEDDVADQVAAAVKEAVRRQMVADVPVGAFLSGGLDSTSVVACAAQTNPANRLQCFTIEVMDGSVATEGFANDLPFAKRAAEYLGVDLHTVQVGPEMADRLGEMIYHLDEPTADPAALNALFISELAREKGITVLLSGAGGDDIFTGYRRHFALSKESYWSWLPSGVRTLLAGAGRSLPPSSPFMRRIGKALQYADLSPSDRLASYFYWLQPDTALGLLNRDFAAGLTPATLAQPMLASLGNLPKGVDPLHRMLYLECKHFLADHNLNYTDKMGMAASIEVRVPLLDLDLVALAARIPPEMKQKGREGKAIFKRAMERYLPRDIIYRPKTGFGVPLRQWLGTRLKPLVDDALSEESLRRRGVFDPRAVARLRQLDTQKQVDATYPIFAMLCLELWCRQYIDGRYPK